MSRKLVIIMCIAMLFGLAACSSQPQPVTVQITLTDFGIQSSQTTFDVGVPYHFEVTNSGQVAHELMLGEPIMAGMMDMEQMDAMAMAHIEEDDLPPGAMYTMDYTFTKAAPAGSLEFSCHIEGHYEAGMNLPIIVK